MALTLCDYLRAEHLSYLSGWLEGMMCGTIIIPPFALYPSEASARLALDDVIQCKTAQPPRVAP